MTTEQPVFDLFTDLSSAFDARYKSDPNFIERWESWTALIDRYLVPGEVVYDLGCGPGVFSFYAASKGGVVTGIDGSDGMIALCREKAEKIRVHNPLQVQFIQDTLPLENPGQWPKAGLIICSSMFEYIPGKEKMLECFRHLLGDNGVLLLSVPNRESVYRGLEKASYRLFRQPVYLAHVHHRFTAAELDKDLEAHGFERMERKYFASHYFLSGLWKMLLPEKKYCNLLLAAYRKKN